MQEQPKYVHPPGCDMEDDLTKTIRENYDRLAEEYTRHLFDELKNKPLDRELLDRFAREVAGRGDVCDLGCGPGHVARYLHARGVPVFGVGKIHDIYNGRGVEDYVTTRSNADGMDKLEVAAREGKQGLTFCNLVDFDMLYGHRKDVEGFAKSLEEFDAALNSYLPLLSEGDLLLLTADHGCDPDPRWETTDHSREYVPILAYAPQRGMGSDLGIRATLADMGQTIAENFGASLPHGKTFLSQIV